MILEFPYYHCDVLKLDSMIDGIINLNIDNYPTEINSDGAKIWRNQEGELHRDNGPAVIYPNGQQEYYQNECLHRLDGPAIVIPFLYYEYYQNGKRHRLDGPSIMRSDGYQAYWVDGKRHRIDGPAVIDENHREEYWVNGKRNRLDGPAVIDIKTGFLEKNFPKDQKRF